LSNDNLILALDFDDTYTANPELWDSFIILSQMCNTEVVIATYRHEVEDADPALDRIKRLGTRCYFTDGKAKKPFLEALGVNVNIWIDDRPQTVYMDSAWAQNSPELHAWREANAERLKA
jgi:hypothetical protein